MAKYLIPVGPSFTPFSYEELAQPIMYLNEKHEAAVDEYDKLLMDTAALGNYIDADKDPETKKLYDAYNKKFNDLYDNLQKYGYNAGTRRDLSAVRAGYASDISRIIKAVESRQAKGKEYWDMIHSHPDLVAGADPSLDSLDLYMKNDNYGSDWYSYSGNTFADEVQADMDARANELLRDPEIIRNPRIAGYIQEKRQIGFTNDEINRAGSAAWNYLKGDTSEYDSLDDITKIAAGVLINRMNSTGATFGENGNLSEKQYRRLFDYGLRGAARGIKAPEIRDYEDKSWELQSQIALAGAKAAASGASAGSGLGSGFGYAVDPTIVQRGAETSSEVSKDLAELFYPKAFRNGETLSLNLPDGRTVPVHSAAELSAYVYDTPERRKIQEYFGGIDIGLKAQDLLGTKKSRQSFTIENDGDRVEFQTGNISASEARQLGISAENPVGIYQIVHGKRVLNPSYTQNFNKLLEAHNNRVAEIKALNRRNIDFDKASISPKQEREFEKKYNLDPRLNPSDIPAVLAAKTNLSNASPAVLVDSSESMSSIRQDYLNSIFASYTEGRSYSGKKNPKDTEFSFYKMEDGGNEIGKENTTKLSDVFTLDGKGVPKSGSLLSIQATPSDISKGMLRITTDKGVFGIKASMLSSLTGNSINNSNFQQGLQVAMLPFTNPDKVLIEAPNSIVEIINDNGMRQPVTMSDVILNPDVQRMYYTTLLAKINQVLANPREIKGQQHYQVTGNTSTKPSSINLLPR